MSSASYIHNRGCVPNLESEGVLLKPLDLPGVGHGDSWEANLSPFERMHCHHTLASVRRYSHFIPHSGLIPQDELDLVLSSQYQHGLEVFPDKVDTILQPETCGVVTWRKLQNTISTRGSAESNAKSGEDRIEEARRRELGRSNLFDDREKGECRDILRVYNKPYNKHHPVRIGGILQRRHPSNIKLMNSSHHSPQTNGGYTRKEGDGNHFNY